MSRFSQDDAPSLDLRLLRQSGSAWLVRDGAGTEAWLPVSQVVFPPLCRVGETITVEVPAWLVEKEGLE